MKRLMMKTGAKTGAILILTLCILLFIGSIAGTVYLYGTGAVNQRGMKYYETDIFQYQLSDSAWQYINYYYYNSDAGKKELEEREKEAETSGEDVSSDDGLASDNIVTGSVSEGSRVYTVDRWQQIVGDTVAVIPGWDDMREGSYEIKVGGYSYTVETTADGKKRFVNEDGSVAFLLYKSHRGIGNEYIGYIPGNLTDEYDFMNYSIYELENQMYKEGCAFLDSFDGDLYFDQQRDVVWIPSDKTEAESDSLYLDSVVYSDVSRESNEDHMNYMSQVAQSHSAADFENMNVHLAVYSSGAAESDSAVPESEDNTPLTEDPVLGKYMTKDLLSVSEKIRARSVSSAEGTADVSALGEKVSENYSYSGGADYSVTIDYSNGLSIVCTVTDPMKNIDVFLLVKIFHTIFVPLGTWIILVDILLGILCLMLFVFLMLAAGRRPLTESGADGETETAQEPVPEEPENPESGYQKRFRKKERKAALRASQGYEIKESFIDRIPFDLFLLIFLSILGALLAVDIASAENIAPAPWRTLPPSQAYPILCAAVAAAAGGILLCILFFMSCAVRAKIGGLLRNTLIWRILIRAAKILGKAGKKILGPMWGGMREALSNIALQWKLAAGFLLIVIVNLLAGSQFGLYGSGFLIFLGIVFDIVVFLLILAVGMMLRSLQTGGKALADGDLSAKVDTSKMRGVFREHGENLNNISRGMAIAIERQMKSERMKTELITNVSHDIKTPLTSIVNYVDLLNKENLGGRAGEYVEVLVRQSARLKKLTEDLVEASKASTGNISVSLRPVDVCEMINQASGEYAERLSAASLSIVSDFPDGPAVARADGRLLWRVLDNLLSNVCKYSMPGTRVYITVSAERETAVSYGLRGSLKGDFSGENDLRNIPESGGPGKNIFRNFVKRQKRTEDKSGTGKENHTPVLKEDDFTERKSVSGRVCIEIKNISKERLNVAPDELMERFVRGDSSRTTEGSGLGLNIARSLTELQKGTFGISIDGDLFKAEIILPEDEYGRDPAE